MYNILVVDDDKEIVKAIEIYLGKENQLFDFKCFEIKFEVTPDIYSKHAKVFYQ